jgi:signal peptide peptidase SppA
VNIFENFWCGTDNSLAMYLSVLQRRETRDVFAEVSAQYATTGGGPKQEAEVPRLFSQSGDVGIITISGSLVNDNSPWNKYDGLSGYPEIREALIHAATDPAVGAIVLDINSGGGSVSGVSDTASLIKQIDTKIKAVHTYSDGMIASAAYWLGSSARSVKIGNVTEAGSIGVLTVHKEMSQMLEQRGIKATVLRAGTYKALGNPYETLSDTAKAEIQGQLDTMYQMFAQHVSDARGVPYPVADQQMGQGRVFIGAKAVQIGLADAVSTFDAVVAELQGEIDSQKKPSQYGANIHKGSAVKTALTQQQIAIAAESGLALKADLSPVSLAAAAVVAAAAAAVPTDAPAAGTPTEAAPVVAPEVLAAAGEAKAESDLVLFLKTSLAEAQAQVMTMTMAARAAEATAPAAAAAHAAMRGIAVASVDRLRIALNQPSGGSEALADELLLAEHASLRAQFEGKFKAGGLAAVSSSDTPVKGAEATADPLRQARLASTRTA